MSEGILHAAPPYTSTDAELDYIAEKCELVLNHMEGVIDKLPAK
jgi:adenosylmethionine-8-amino-7-oxononanoate aminotransferase